MATGRLGGRRDVNECRRESLGLRKSALQLPQRKLLSREGSDPLRSHRAMGDQCRSAPISGFAPIAETDCTRTPVAAGNGTTTDPR